MDVGLPAVVETLGNLVFLTSKCADNPELVRIYMTHAKRCVSILNQYVKTKFWCKKTGSRFLVCGVLS
jgi:hypothetical protein